MASQVQMTQWPVYPNPWPFEALQTRYTLHALHTDVATVVGRLLRIPMPLHGGNRLNPRVNGSRCHFGLTAKFNRLAMGCSHLSRCFLSCMSRAIIGELLDRPGPPREVGVATEVDTCLGCGVARPGGWKGRAVCPTDLRTTFLVAQHRNRMARGAPTRILADPSKGRPTPNRSFGDDPHR